MNLSIEKEQELESEKKDFHENDEDEKYKH